MKFLILFSLFLISCSSTPRKNVPLSREFNEKELLKILAQDTNNLKRLTFNETMGIWKSFLKNARVQAKGEMLSHHIVMGNYEQIESLEKTFECPIKVISNTIPLHEDSINGLKFVLKLEEKKIIKTELYPQCMKERDFLPEARVEAISCCSKGEDFLALTERPFDLRFGEEEDFIFYRVSEHQILGKNPEVKALFNTSYTLDDYIEGVLFDGRDKNKRFTWRGWSFSKVKINEFEKKYNKTPLFGSVHLGKGRFLNKDTGFTLNDVMSYLSNPTENKYFEKFFLGPIQEEALKKFAEAWDVCLKSSHGDCFKELVSPELLEKTNFKIGDCDSSVASNLRLEGKKFVDTQYLSGVNRRCEVDWIDGKWRIISTKKNEV